MADNIRLPVGSCLNPGKIKLITDKLLYVC
jgi:hypothetical protein